MESHPVAGVARQLAFNPLVMACAVGIALQATGLGLPPGLEPMRKTLGQASLPVGLLCVGAALDFGSARSWWHPVLAASSAKLVLMPLITAVHTVLAGAAIPLVFMGLRGLTG